MDVDLRVRPELLTELRRSARELETRGRLVFVVGEGGSGRSETLAAFADELRRDDRQPVIARFRFTGPEEVVPVTDDRQNRVSAAFATVGAAGSAGAMIPILAPALVPVALLAQLAQALADSHQATRQLPGLRESRRLEEPGDLLAMLRIATRISPVVCILDDFSKADLVWWRLFLRDGGPELVRMRLLIVAAVNETSISGDMTARHEDLAASLESWFATTVRVGPAHAGELEAQVGRIAEPLRTDVIDLAGGNAGLVEDLWHELIHDRAVEFVRDQWRWRPGRPTDYFGLVREVFDRRIRERCETEREREIAWAVVRMAAIEGVNFTPAAVVNALQRIGLDGFADADAVIDLIDETLGTGDPSLLVVDDEAVRWRTGGEDHFAFRAHFTNRGHAEALRRYGLAEEERASWATALGFALSDLYAGNANEVGLVLVDVWRQAREPQIVASTIRRCAGVYKQQRLRALMRAEAAGAMDRLIYVGYRLEMATQLSRSDPQQALEIARSALAAAEQTGSSTAVAASLIAIANPLRALQDFREALPHTTRAVALEGVDPGTRWSARYSLASSHLGLADCSCPKDHLGEATRLSEELLATAPTNLDQLSARMFEADILTVKQQYPEALKGFLEGEKAARSLGSFTQQLVSIRQAAFVLIEMTRFDEALATLERARNLARSEGDAISAASIQHESAYTLYQMGALEPARAALLELGDDWTELGSTQLLAGVLAMLGEIARRGAEAMIADELAGLLAVLLMDAGERRARAEQDAEVARRADALLDLGNHLRNLHSAVVPQS